MKMNKHVGRMILLFGFIVLVIAIAIMMMQTFGNRQSSGNSLGVSFSNFPFIRN